MKLSAHLVKKTLSDEWEWPSNCTALRIFLDGRICHLNGHFATKTEQTDITGVAGICRHEDYLWHWENEMKLIDLLVKELPKRGGYPEAANYAVQDSDGTVKFSKSISFLHIEVGEWCSNEDGDDWIYGDRPFEGNFHHYITANDWKVSIVTREQYKTALAASKAVVGHDGWIEWGGGECPVKNESITSVKHRDGLIYDREHPLTGAADIWTHSNHPGDIIAYRLHKQDTNSRANDDRLEQDLNECIGQDGDTPCSDAPFPPEGIEIEYSTHGQKAWYRGIVTACGESMCIVKNLSGAEQAFHKFDIEFRPLRNEAEKERETACHEIASLIGRGTFFEDAERIYDAGYRKENK